MPKISACIVAYCDYDEVCAAVRSILHYTPAPDLALYVVDNGSPDGCGRQLAETDFGDSRVTVLPLEKNIGFGKGRVAAGPARGRHGNAPAALPGRQAAAPAPPQADALAATGAAAGPEARRLL